MAILLKNATYIDGENLRFSNPHIIVHQGIDDKLEFVDAGKPIDESNFSKIIDCTGKLVTKSFVVGHHHVYSALAKGMPAPKKSPENFREILQYVWWTLDKSLDKDTIEASALASAIACAKAGTTFVIDHHASPNFIGGSLDIIAKAFDKVGVSHLLAYEITDRDGMDKAQAGLEESESYLSKNQGLVGMHASFTVNDKTMKQAADLMQKLNSGFHIHVAEGIYDQTHCVEKYDKRVVERLADYGVLNSSKTILVHGLHLDDRERELIKNSPVWVAQNNESNMNNAVGHFNGDGMGSNIMFGTDGMHSDMLQSAKSAFFAGQGADTIDYPGVYDRFRKAHRYIESNDFKGDGKNNLVVLNYDGPTELTSENFLGHFVFGINSNHVEHVISDGRLIVENREITTVNEEEVLRFTREQSLRLWKQMQK
jgi:cytosine/adenosine deaminase-related metal-dependent hydrolase